MRDSASQTERNKATALSYIHEGIGAQDTSVFRYFREDARFWQNGKKLELAGYHDMKELAELTPKAMGKFPNGMKFEILTVTAEENRVLIESESDAVLANGTQYNNQYVFAFYFDEAGKILEFREYWDPLYAYETMFEGKTRL
jgi:ketosteroid isomerase-like protein